MSFRHLLSPILRRFGVLRTERNTQRLAADENTFQTKKARCQTKRAIVTSTSLTSFEKNPGDEIVSPKMLLKDISSQDTEHISLCESENKTVESTNIREGSSGNEMTGNIMHEPMHKE